MKNRWTSSQRWRNKRLQLMGDFVKKIPEWIWKNIAKLVKVPRAMAGILAVLTLTCLTIFCKHSYVSIPGSEVLLRLGQFERCTITFKNEVSFESYEIRQDVIMTNMAVGFRTNRVNLSQSLKPNNASILIITNALYIQQKALANTVPEYNVDIYNVASTRCDITKFSIDGEPVNLKEFIKHNLCNAKYKYVRFRYIREDLAQIIYRWNDDVSNWLLTILVSGMCLFMILLLNMEFKSFTTDRHFVKGLESLLKMKIRHSSEQQQIAYDRFHDICVKWNSRFIFLQALGPALGFILTVSSLIASLDPATFSGAGTDLDTFLNGIHVAMIATFIGLLLRLLALEAARVNLLLLRRAFVLLSANNVKVGDAAPKSSERGSCK
jgi:hypothetical protein